MASTSNDSSPVWALGPHLGGAGQHWPSFASSRAPHEQLQLVLAQARQHASMQRLAAQYEQWESSLRREAEERMGGFRPLQRFIEASGTAEDWQLLRRVKSQGAALGGAMKRSASEGALTAEQQQLAPPGAVAHGAQRVHLRQEWDPLGAAGMMPGHHAAGGHYATPHEGARRASGEGYAPASHAPAPSAGPASPQQQQQQQQQQAPADGAESGGAAPPGRFPRAKTAPALRDAARGSEEEEDDDDELGGGAPGAAAYAERLRARMESPIARPASAGAWVGGAGSPDEAAGRQLEAMAARLLQQSRAAIQNAQAAVQETAINCSQNLQTLGALFSGSVGSGLAPGSGSVGGGGGLASLGGADATGSQLQLVPWLAAERPAGGGGDAAPWDAVPRYLRLAAEGAAAGAGSSAGEAGGAAGEAAAGGPASVYRQLAHYFDRLEEERARRRRARQGGAYSSLKEPGRNVAIVTTASLPWMTGTAVNPLLRAAYLANADDGGGGDGGGGGSGEGARRRVTLMLPWLNKSDQERVFPGAVTFDSPSDQEAFVREWAQKRTGLPCDFAVKFYPGRYAPEKGEAGRWLGGGAARMHGQRWLHQPCCLAAAPPALIPPSPRHSPRPLPPPGRLHPARGRHHAVHPRQRGRRRGAGGAGAPQLVPPRAPLDGQGAAGFRV
jgi:hypothetical protein